MKSIKYWCSDESCGVTVGIQIGSKGLVETLILLAFLGTILPSLDTISTRSVIHDVQPYTMVFSTNLANQHQNVTYEGDLVIDDNEIFTIEDSEFYMIGKITVKDTSTLIIRDSKFTTIPSWDGDSIVLMNQANLLITNATVIFKHPGDFECKILVQDYGKANITQSTLRNRGYVVAYNNSIIYVNNSTITVSTRIGTYPASGVATFSTSAAEIKNSTMDGVFVWENSAASVKNSVVGILRTAMEESDKTTVNITNSRVDYIEIWGGAPVLNIEGSTITDAHFVGEPFAWFTSSSVAQISAYSNTKVWLIDSAYGGVETRDNATVLVGWHIPLFGLITMPHTWVSILWNVAFLIIATLSIASLIILYRRWKR